MFHCFIHAFLFALYIYTVMLILHTGFLSFYSLLFLPAQLLAPSLIYNYTMVCACVCGSVTVRSPFEAWIVIDHLIGAWHFNDLLNWMHCLPEFYIVTYAVAHDNSRICIRINLDCFERVGFIHFFSFCSAHIRLLIVHLCSQQKFLPSFDFKTIWHIISNQFDEIFPIRSRFD